MWSLIGARSSPPIFVVPGANSSQWWNMPTISLPRLDQVCPLFECSIGNPPLFPSQEPEAVVPSTLSFIQWSIAGGSLLLPICVVSGFGYVPRTSLSGSPRKLAPRFIGPHGSLPAVSRYKLSTPHFDTILCGILINLWLPATESVFIPSLDRRQQRVKWVVPKCLENCVVIFANSWKWGSK